MSAAEPIAERAAAMAGRFTSIGSAGSAVRHGGGHIHDSFVVTAGGVGWLVQRINTAVFPHPELLAGNIAAVTGQLARALERAGVRDARRRVLTPRPAREGGWLARDEDGGVWRAFDLIEGAVSHERASDAAMAEHAAEAFGTFQRLLRDYSGPPLHETIPRFHDTPARLAALDRAVAHDKSRRAHSAADLIAFAGEPARRASARALAAALADGRAPVRIAHHDAKIANVLFDAESGEALAVVDLDTTMPGLSLYDVGDLVRSMASRAAEDDRDLARARAEPERLAAITRGYLRGAGALLGAAERALIPLAARVIVLEQGARFLADHLEGDRYYRCTRPGQNLDRCRTQFALLASLETLELEFARMVAE